MTKKYAIYAAIFSFFLALFILVGNGRFGGDGLEDYLVAESIVLDGDISIHDRPFQVDEMQYVVRGKIGPEQKMYSGRGIGMPMVIVPFYVVGHLISRFLQNIPHDYITQFAVSFVNPVVTSFIGLALFMLLKKLDFKPATCFLTTLCYGLCTMTIVYTRSGFSDPALTLFTLLALGSIVKYEETKRLGYILIAGSLIGFSLLIKISAVLYLPLFFLYILWKTVTSGNKGRSLVGLWIFALLPVTIFMLVNVFVHMYVRSGGTGTEISDAGKVFTDTMMIKGLFYYLFSPGKAYFFYNIPLFLSLFAVKDMFNEKKNLAIICSVFILTNLFFYSWLFKRGSLFSWGPRYLYPTIPFMCIFLAQFIENAKTKFRKVLISIFCFAGFLVQFPCLFVNIPKYLFFVKEKLNLPEYYINFLPELSPIKGNWVALLSAVKRTITGGSLSIKFDPDYWFQDSIVGGLGGYDLWDIWWVNIMKVSPQLLPAVIIAVSSLCVIMTGSFIWIKRYGLSEDARLSEKTS